jgi:hypothetical protein
MFNFKATSLTTFMAISAVFIVVANKAEASPQPDFTCKVLAHPALQADGYLLGENIYLMGDETVGLTGYADISDQLKRVPSGSGMKFSNGTITFHAKGEEGFLELSDGTMFPCQGVKTVANGTARLGQSLFGSIIRAADDPTTRRLDSIPAGEPIEIISETGSFHDGWQWVKIRYSEGLEGYVWGGTICTPDGPEIIGVHLGCQ